MGQKRFVTKINLRRFAKGQDISVMTLYRVLNNEAAVRESTRDRALPALNKSGFYASLPQKVSKVGFDFSDNRYHTTSSFANGIDELKEFDCLAFSPEEILRWIEYLLSNQPMLKHEAPIQIHVGPHLEIRNSVLNIKGEWQ